MGDILIRAVEPEDWPDVADLFKQPTVIAGTLQLPHRSAESHRRRLAEPPPANFWRFGAVIDGKLVGLAGLTRLEHRRAHVGTMFIAVHDAFQGRGAGAALMEALTDMADRWLALARIELTVFADNARAIGLYERFGFVREGLHAAYAYRDGGFVDAVAMARIRAAKMLVDPRRETVGDRA
ncbi:MAG TPA: GNAT family N-acetyltransferase [Caulobacteraceae bacterium]|nr:GNAT family N-acetyltransferase [Caulobacteraceae bacterium]